MTTSGAASQQAELGSLLAGVVRAVVDAQDNLDTHAREQATAFLAAPAGSLALPPLWFAFDSVSIDIQLSSEVVRTPSVEHDDRYDTRLVCRTLNPVTAGLYGYSAATGTRVTVTLSPQRFLPSTPVAQEAQSSPT
jgi:hypothetical protein